MRAILASRAALPLVAFVAGTALAGCGGSNPEPKAPAATAPGPAPLPASGNANAAPGVGPSDLTPSPGTGAQLVMNGSAASAYRDGAAAYQKGDLAAAKAAFQNAISADSSAYQAHYSLATVLERLGDSSALTEYRQAYTIKPDYFPAVVAYALLVARRGNLTEAESFLNGQRAKFPNSAAVIAGLAEVKSMQRDTGSAQQLAQEALKKNADYRPAMVTIARDHYRNRRLDLALYALQAILDGFGDDNPPRDKDNADARYLRGLILKEEGRGPAAIADFKRAVELRPDLVDARVELAAYYLEAGNAADAEPLLTGALRFDANNVVAHLNLGDCYRLQGRIPEAKAQFDWVLAHDPSRSDVHYDLALLYLFSPQVPGLDPKGQVDQAVAEINKYQQMRGRGSASDDSDELLNRAKQKLADIQAQAVAKEPVAAPPSSGSGAAVPGAKAGTQPPPKPAGGAKK